MILKDPVEVKNGVKTRSPLKMNQLLISRVLIGTTYKKNLSAVGYWEKNKRNNFIC